MPNERLKARRQPRPVKRMATPCGRREKFLESDGR